MQKHKISYCLWLGDLMSTQKKRGGFSTHFSVETVEYLLKLYDTVSCSPDEIW